VTNPPLLYLGLETRTQIAVEFVYVGDPMCSWCWGFAPALEKLESRYGIPLRVVMGGLRTGSQAEPMDTEARQQLAGYWQGVAQRTGQPFTNASLVRDGWSYDTEPSCRAVVTMRQTRPTRDSPVGGKTSPRLLRRGRRHHRHVDVPRAGGRV